MANRSSRRTFMQTAALTAPAISAAAAAKSTSGVYSRLGIRPVINGVGVVTVLGGSIMPPEVVAAMEEASRHFVPLIDLQKA
ncbi:MAG: hypothetical protein ABIZ80_07625, partial [Bryobacteraceae bacterium]